MSRFNWKATIFLAKTSSAPLTFAILSITGLMLIGLIVGSFYEIDYRISVNGEVASLKGHRDVTSNLSGVMETKALRLGQVIKENEVIGYVKMQYTDQKEVSDLLSKLQNLNSYALNSNHFETIEWPDISSENSFVSEHVLQAKQALNEYNNELKIKRRFSDLQLKNLGENKTRLQRKLNILTRSKHRSLTQSLIEEQRREINLIQEEMARIKSEDQIKASEIKNRLLSELKNCYLRIHEFMDSHVIKSFETGKISKIYTQPTQQIKKDQPILVLSPLDEEFELRLKIPTYAAGKIISGLTLKAEVDAYPYQRFGMFRGVVRRIDKIITQDKEEMHFYAYSSIGTPENTRNLSSSVQLLAGMKVKAHIILKRLTINQMLYEKIFVQHENL